MAPSDAALPSSARRLLPHYDGSALASPGAASTLIARLLEDGDREDLRWLFTTHAEPAIAAWLAARGGRALSRRSRAYWSRVLGISPLPAPPAARELWPLA